MENMSRWKIIRIGFLLGIGFIVPQVFVILGGTLISALAIPPLMQQAFEEETGGILPTDSSGDSLNRVKINSYNEQPIGGRLLILGTIENISDTKASSIQLEAELLNSSGEFVYECTEYINKDLQPGEVENYQISCGCGDTTIPEHTDITVRVVSISNY